ncbi:MAG: hypothetical protein AAF351_07830 [Pseudomonadota bacterium]
MRDALPFILIFLAIFTAGCIAYIAWEVSSGDPQAEDDPRPSANDLDE